MDWASSGVEGNHKDGAQAQLYFNQKEKTSPNIKRSNSQSLQPGQPQ
jgi:hypothetical protein